MSNYTPQNFVWVPCGGTLGGRPPGPPSELPLVGGNCAYVARDRILDRCPCRQRLPGAQSAFINWTPV